MFNVIAGKLQADAAISLARMPGRLPHQSEDRLAMTRMVIFLFGPVAAAFKFFDTIVVP